MEKHPLHIKIPDLQTSPEVVKAVSKKERLTDENIPNDPNDRIEAYMDRLERLIIDPNKKQNRNDLGDVLHTERSRALRTLRNMVMNEYVRSNKKQMAEGAARVEERVARQIGINAEYDENLLEQLGDIAVGDLESSLDEWIKYLSDQNEPYPTWFRYYVFRNILNLGEYDKDKQEFPKRSRGTFKLFPDVDRGALAYVQEMMEAYQDDTVLNRIREAQKTLWDTPDTDLLTKEKAKTFFNLSFAKQYAEGIKQNGEISPELRQETEGKWVHYKKGDDPKALWLSLQNKGTAWCTKGFPTAQKQLEGGDFYVYYTYDATHNPTIPRIAIRMEGDKKIAENPRGVFDSQQNLEPNMVLIMEEKLKEFGSEADKFKKKSEDMKLLTKIEKKTETGIELTKEDLIFLWEFDSEIEGFGYEKDPRVEEIRNKRDTKIDYAIIFGCKPEDIVVGRPDDRITSTTKVYSFGEGSIDYKVLPLLRPDMKVYAELPNKPIEFVNPKDIDYKKLVDEPNTYKSGTQTINPEMMNIDLEKAKVFVPDLSQFNGKPLYEVMKYVADTYGSKYKIAGLEYREFIRDNPAKAPQELKDTNLYFFFFGSVFRGGSGVWRAPCTRWGGSQWLRDSRWLGRDWYSDYRLVLLEI